MLLRLVPVYHSQGVSVIIAPPLVVASALARDGQPRTIGIIGAFKIHAGIVLHGSLAYHCYLSRCVHRKSLLGPLS